jgi:hypothetical protein
MNSKISKLFQLISEEIFEVLDPFKQPTLGSAIPKRCYHERRTLLFFACARRTDYMRFLINRPYGT